MIRFSAVVIRLVFLSCTPIQVAPTISMDKEKLLGKTWRVPVELVCQTGQIVLGGELLIDNDWRQIVIACSRFLPDCGGVAVTRLFKGFFFQGKPDQAGGSEFAVQFRIPAGDTFSAVPQLVFLALIYSFRFRMVYTGSHNGRRLLNSTGGYRFFRKPVNLSTGSMISRMRF